ncbi:MAG: ABC transporter ATP-binding protein [Planctomycetota bacterium]|nr:ABC transporter ATP-binding protein [Planctomycetota bacterium]
MPGSFETSRSRFERSKNSTQEAGQGRNAGGHHGGHHSGTPQPRERSALALISSFSGLMRPYRLSLTTSLAAATIATGLALLPPAATKFVVDYVLARKPLPNNVPDWVPRDRHDLLFGITAVVLLLSFFKVGVQIWSRWHATRITMLIRMTVRKRIFEHAIRLPLHRVQELKSGGAASIVRQDAESVGDLVFGLIYNPWRAVVQLIGTLLILSLVDWRLLLGAVVIMPIVYLTHRAWIGRIRPQHRGVRAQREEVDALVTESFGGMRVVRAFGRQRTETNRVMRGNHLMGRRQLYAWWLTRTIEVVWSTLIPLASAVLLIYGGWRVLDEVLTLGDLMMFLVYLLMMLGPVSELAQSAAQLQNGLAGLDRILELLDESREMSNADSTAINKADVEGHIELRNVSFRYPHSEEFALREVTLDVAPGETIALVGPSGAGKTTLSNLVARFYNPSEGEILLDGRDVSEIEVESYRRLLGIVEQDVFLFDGTIADNIGYGGRHSSVEVIRHAAEVANIREFIEGLPASYDTVIGERGVRLSGGQRQRVAIARAVLADPKILILDEATSNLDTESERLIQAGLTELMKNRTSFVIAHRLSTITHADRIAVIEAGRITEIGTHDELMRQHGKYREMVAVQTAGHSSEAGE